MGILRRGVLPVEEARSWDEIDSAILVGFVVNDNDLSSAKRKTAAARLRACAYAVDRWLLDGVQPLHGDIASAVGMSDRWLSIQFPRKNELYAFPPAEMARSCALLSGASVSHEWDDIAQLVRPAFTLLQASPVGMRLMAGLVLLHRSHPELDEADAAFSLAMREELRERRSVRTLSIVELFAGGVRLAFQDWVDAGQPDLVFVADRVTAFINGPVRCAYDALLDLPGPTPT
jgi:hypothetical protein